ncbi:MAG: hypothetical protein ACYC99_09710 [Candidatus Geothermincolia bacterium]
MAKKKKKKAPAGARKSTYAKGKKVEPEPAKGSKKKAAPVSGRPAPKAAVPEKAQTKAGAKTEAAPPVQQFNLIKRGSIEMTVFLIIIVIVAIAALFQYPLAIQDATTSYNKLKREYPAELKKFEEKYKTPAEQKKHAKEKPVMPKKPTFGDFLLYQALFLIAQGAIFAFLALNIQRRTDLQTPLFDKVGLKEVKAGDLRDLVTWSIPFGIIVLIPPLISTLIGKSLGFIKASDFKKTPAWKLSLSYINIAINNEILFTFLVFTAMVWIFAKYHEKVKLEPHWLALGVATVLQFGYIYWVSSSAGEKPVTAIIGAVFLAITISAILGYLYWRKGLEYSLLAGVIGFGLYPFLARLIIK